MRGTRKQINERVNAVIKQSLTKETFATIAEALGISLKQARSAREKAIEILRQEQSSQPTAPEPEKSEKPKPIRISKIDEIVVDIKPDKVHRYILTAAQDDTPVHKDFWNNLAAFAVYKSAEVVVAGYTYQKGLFEDHAVATAAYASEIRDHIVYDRVRFGSDLLFVSDANILPTAANPLQGWQTTNSGQHVVVPHARIALESIPRMQGQPPRYAISTGCCTVPSYAPRAAGRKAIFHHTYGALLVEIDIDGEVFFHQIVGDDDGSFQVLDEVVSGGKIFTEQRVAAITWGDIHHDQLDQAQGMAAWGYDRKTRSFVDVDNLLDRLRPHYSILEDTLDFRWRNHHNIQDPISMAKMAARGTVCVEQEVTEAVRFANGLLRDWCQTVVIESNHDSAIAKWLRGDEGRYDPENAYLWHRLNADWHDAVRMMLDDFNITYHAFRSCGLSEDVFFVPAGGSLVVQDVEHGLHGDIGVNGARGTPTQFRRFGRKVTSGHTHSPRIQDGSYVAGVSAKLDQGYNVGPTTWAHAHVVLYPNGKRGMISMSADGRYEARN